MKTKYSIGRNRKIINITIKGNIQYCYKIEKKKL